MDRIMRSEIKEVLELILRELLARTIETGYYPAVESDLAGYTVYNPVSGQREPVLVSEDPDGPKLERRFSFDCRPWSDGMRFTVAYGRQRNGQFLRSEPLPLEPNKVLRKQA